MRVLLAVSQIHRMPSPIEWAIGFEPDVLANDWTSYAPLHPAGARRPGLVIPGHSMCAPHRSRRTGSAPAPARGRGTSGISAQRRKLVGSGMARARPSRRTMEPIRELVHKSG